jgi:hypothetical protein
MTDALTTLPALAVSVHRRRAETQGSDWAGFLWSLDPLLDEAQSAAGVLPDEEVLAAEDLLLAEPDLANLAPVEGDLDPMVLNAGGGHRLGKGFLTAGLLSSAFQRVFLTRLPNDEGTFVRTVVEGYDELRRASRGERIRAHLIEGVVGVTLPDGAQLNTPWGTLRPAPPVDRSRFFRPGFTPDATCTLTDTRLIAVVFDRSSEPSHEFDHSEVSSERARILLPVACALANPESAVPAMPMLTWSTMLLPFAASHGYSMPFLSIAPRTSIDIGAAIPAIEDWARRVETSHASGIMLPLGDWRLR